MIKGDLISKNILDEIPEKPEGYYKDLFDRFKSLISVKVENETEIKQKIIVPVFLNVLGYKNFNAEYPYKKDRSIRVDLLFYKEEDERDKLLVEVKNRGVDFDGGAADQTKSYLQFLKSEGIKFGVLTDGFRYRIYYIEKLSDYLEFDFSKADNDEDFVRFYYLLGAKGFPENLNGILDKDYEYWMKRSEDLLEGIFTDVIPTLARCFYKTAGGDLKLIYEKILIFLFRLMFLFYAEDRELIPLWKTHYSTQKMRESVNDKFSSDSDAIYGMLLKIFDIIDKGSGDLGIPPYNGGLFKRDEFFEKTSIDDKTLMDIIKKLSYDKEGKYINYRYLSTRHLGFVYETILEYGLKKDGDNFYLERLEGGKNPRKLTGSYYTPEFVVKFITRSAIDERVNDIVKRVEEKFEEIENLSEKKLLEEFKKLKLDPKVEEGGKLRDLKPKELRNKLKEYYDPIKEILNIKIIDPAMGSGHFLVEAIEYLYQKLRYVADKFKEDYNYESPFLKYEVPKIKSQMAEYLRKYNVNEDISDEAVIKRIILKRCIYGIDKNELAVELAKISLWLSSFAKGMPLSFLDHHLKVGNSIYGEGIKSGADLFNNQNFARAKSIISTVSEIADVSLEHTKKSEELYNIYESLVKELREDFNRGYDKSLSPFHYILEFPDVFSKDPKNYGFDIVISNPPYIRQERIKDFKGYLSRAYKDVFDGKADIYVYFYKRGMDILKEGGILGFISSNKFFRAAYGKNLRRFLSGYKILKVLDFGGYRVFKDATVDTAILLIKKERFIQNKVQVLKGVKKDVVFKEGLDIVELARLKSEGKEIADIFEYFDKNHETVDQTKNFSEEIFLTEGSDILKLREKIEKIGKPLKDWNVKIYRGIITGFNEAFIIDTETRNRILANCKTEEERKRTEEIIKPVLRGRDIGRYYYRWEGLWVIYAYQGIEINKYPALLEHLSQFKSQLEKRTGGARWNRDKTKILSIPYKWYELQVDYHKIIEEFEKEKVVWQEMSYGSAFAYDDEKIYTNQTAYIMVGEHLKYLLGVLNSKVSGFYIKSIAYSLSEGAQRWIKQYVEKIPIPPITQQNQKIANQIVNLVDQILSIKKQNPDADTSDLENKIDQLVYKLYGLTEDEIRIILKSKP